MLGRTMDRAICRIAKGEVIALTLLMGSIFLSVSIGVVKTVRLLEFPKTHIGPVT
jgi:hypothetical protein